MFLAAICDFIDARHRPDSDPISNKFAVYLHAEIIGHHNLYRFNAISAHLTAMHYIAIKIACERFQVARSKSFMFKVKRNNQAIVSDIG